MKLSETTNDRSEADNRSGREAGFEIDRGFAAHSPSTFCEAIGIGDQGLPVDLFESSKAFKSRTAQRPTDETPTIRSIQKSNFYEPGFKKSMTQSRLCNRAQGLRRWLRNRNLSTTKDVTPHNFLSDDPVLTGSIQF
jgi:hypothetical protein